MLYSLSKLREQGEGREENRAQEGEERAIWQCMSRNPVTVSLTFGNSNYGAERNTPVRHSLYEVACLTVGLRCAT